MTASEDRETPNSALRTFSFGGGVQSTAALVLAAQKRIDFPVFLFCNVGEDSEHPRTLAYVREVAMPFAARHGIQLEELRDRRRDGTPHPSLYRRLTGPGSRSLPIPVRMATTGAPGTRFCTASYLTRFGRPLGEVFAAEQGVRFEPNADSSDFDACESGYCMT